LVRLSTAARRQMCAPPWIERSIAIISIIDSDREDASSTVTAGATANTTEGNSRASRESGLLCSHSHGEYIDSDSIYSCRAENVRSTIDRKIGRSDPNLKPGTVCVCGMNGLRQGMDTTQHPPSPASRAGTDLSTNVQAISRAVSYVHTHRPIFQVSPPPQMANHLFVFNGYGLICSAI